MTPLELSAVGVIVVLVWMAGGYAGNRYVAGEHPRTAWAPFWVGLFLILVGIKDLIWLGIKEAVK